MRRRFWQHLHEAVFQDKTHFYAVFNVDCRLVYEKFRIGTELTFIGTVLRLKRIFTHVIIGIG